MKKKPILVEQVLIFFSEMYSNHPNLVLAPTYFLLFKFGFRLEEFFLCSLISGGT